MEDKQLSTSPMGGEEVGTETCRKTGLLHKENTIPHCQGLNKTEVGEEDIKGLDQCSAKCTSLTFSDPLEEISMDKACPPTINVKQKRVSRRDEHEHRIHSYGQSEDVLAYNRNIIGDDLSLPSQTEV